MTPRARVLIAEDDPAFRRVISFSIESKEGLTEVVSSGDKALQLLQSGTPFDFLVTDHQMPGISGVELIAQVRNSGFQSLEIVLCTAKGMELDTETLVKQYRLLRVFNKPFSPNSLATLLQQTFREKSAYVLEPQDVKSSAWRQVVEPAT